MVQFSRIRLSGFKSFVEPTELYIQSGLTGIVGPNGCGKSNLVEALRWVMGETSAKQVRGGEMDDVIFKGTDGRPARNLAEVMLSLDNFDRSAPAAYNGDAEIDVARRVELIDRQEAERIAEELGRAGAIAEPGVVAPRIEDAPPSVGQGRTGTAFIVDPNGVLLTAHHVIDRAASITVSCNGRAAVPVTVTSSSPTVDLAVLTAGSDLGTDTFLRLASTQQPALGDEVFTVGYPTPALLGRDPKYTNGTVSALSGVGGDASFMQISVPIQPGNSGGPLVNQNGEVIGVVVATADAPAFIRATDSIPQNINWAVKSVFASALFTSPAANAGTDVAPADVIAHVTDATCLVEATGAAQ